MAILFAVILALIGISSLLTEKRLSEAVPASASAESSEEESSDGEPDAPSSDTDAQPGQDTSQEESAREEPAVSKEDPSPLQRRGKPDEMRGVYLSPGVDYPINGDAQTIREGISSALSKAKNLTMNTVVALLDHEDGVIYKTEGTPSANAQVDILQTLIEEARARELYIYAVYDVSAGTNTGMEIGTDLIQSASESAADLARSYALDGVLIGGCENAAQPDSYAQYMKSQSGIGYQNYMCSLSEALMRGVSEALREHGDGLQVGLIVDGVWENAARREEGSQTSSARTQLHEGNADTRKWITEGLADFAAWIPRGATDSAAESFKTVSSWWAALCEEAGIPLYVLHRADLVCSDTAGYRSPDELTQQVIYARESKGYQGSLFNSLSRMEENPQSSTDLLIKLYNGQVNIGHVLTRLAVTQPNQSTFSTFEPVVSFRGASDPNFEVKLDGEALETDENGYFSTTKDLEPGVNQFTFEHKGKTQSFTITRNVQIIKEVTPSGNVGLEGGMRLQVSALALAEASVSASLGGQSITLQRDDTIDDDSDEGSAYKRFTGSFTAPAATAQRQELGTITVSGSWGDVSDSKQGASVAVNAVVPAGDGDLVIVTADSAKTFPTNVLNNESNPEYFPLPQGTLDYMTSDKLSFTNNSGTYYYYKLQSGLRVYAQDVSKTSGDLSLGNAISDMQVSSDQRFTYVALKTVQHVPYLVDYTGSAISFDFQYTSATPESQKIENNPVISSADWSGSKLTLRFVRNGSFLGYYAYYQDDDTLVLRLTNPPLSIAGVRVAIDPGHGGKDPGAPGYYPDVSEAEINRAIAERTAQALRNQGASVKLIQSDPYLTLWERIDEAAAFDADIFISIHGNSLDNNSTTAGTEVYYFYSNGQPLAAAISSRVASALDTANRGAKDAQYVVTSDVRFASVLVETGFISNQIEYNKLIKASYQDAVAQAIADGVRAYIGAVSTGISGGNDSAYGRDEDKTENEDAAKSEEEPSTENSRGESGVTDVELDKTDITLNVGESYQFEARLSPEDADGSALRWESDDEDVAEVSASGKVSAIGAGNAQITVSSEDGAHSASCIVRVKGG